MIYDISRDKLTIKIRRPKTDCFFIINRAAEIYQLIVKKF